jgi:hypothetical protein
VNKLPKGKTPKKEENSERLDKGVVYSERAIEYEY